MPRHKLVLSVRPTGGGWGGWRGGYEGKKKVSVPKMGLLLLNLFKMSFFPRGTFFWFWVVWSGGGGPPDSPPPPPLLSPVDKHLPGPARWEGLGGACGCLLQVPGHCPPIIAKGAGSRGRGSGSGAGDGCRAVQGPWSYHRPACGSGATQSTARGDQRPPNATERPPKCHGSPPKPP